MQYNKFLDLAINTCFPRIDGNGFAEFYAETCIGGAQGGSCWGDEAYGYSSDADFDEISLRGMLDFILECFPDVKYSSIRKIEKEILSFTRTENEYYGNYREYMVRQIKVKKVYDILMSEIYPK
jgi:hypothetical protein